MHILTNFARFPAEWKVSTGQSGTAKVLNTTADFIRQAPSADLILLNGNVRLILSVCAAFTALPFRRKPVIAVDMVLRRPEVSRLGLAGHAGKRFLYSKIDHFIHYFKDLRDYDRYFGIGPRRSSFVDFKPNIRNHHEAEPNSDGGYVLCFGRSMRDYDTFFAAMERVPYPGAIPQPDFPNLAKHGSRFTRRLDQLPPHMSVLPDDGSSGALVKMIGGARVVVLPILKSSLLAGVGTYLNAMYMKKCVIISRGPGASDVLTPEQAVFVEPEAPDALASAIQQVWENPDLRERIAAAGYTYAASLGGEPELQQRILEIAVDWFISQRRNARP